MMPLSMAKPGETVTVQRVTGKDEVRQHLAELGFVAGAEVRVVSETGGNLIVMVKNARVALDRSMANRVQAGLFQEAQRARVNMPARMGALSS